jgi:serine/threonine protein kinase
MTGCPSNDTLDAFLAGVLDSDRETVLHQHVDGCSACRELLAVLGQSLFDEALAPTVASDAPTGDRAALPGDGSLLGRYVIERVLGAGAMGVVYAARDTQLDRGVAIKLVRRSPSIDDARARMVREAQAMARLSHPNVVTVFDVGARGDTVFIAMELVVGRTLRAWLDEEPRAPREVVAAFVDAGRGLVAAHEVGIVHRDFKPDNVLVGRDGRVRVTDFGLARTSEVATPDERGLPTAGARERSAAASRRTSFAGTPAYAAPEQFAGGRIDARTDQFAFSVALYEALYGERPFEGDDTDALYANIVAGRVREPKRRVVSVSMALRRALLRGLAARPEDRFATMDALLREILHAEGPKQMGGSRGRVLGALLAGAAVMVALIAVPLRARISRADSAKITSEIAPVVMPSASLAPSSTFAPLALTSSSVAAPSRPPPSLAPHKPTVVRAQERASEQSSVDDPLGKRH